MGSASAASSATSGAARALRASVSHGLKRGRNVLKVRRGKRATTVRFRVRPDGPLVGAGLDRQVAGGGPVDLKALVRGASRGDRVRWRIVDRSRAFGRGERTPASLRSHSLLMDTGHRRS
jgi:hypothetical protein